MYPLLLLLGAAANAAPPTLSAGYNGDFISHPGAFVGASWRTAETGAQAFSVGFDLGGYHHERNHTGLFLRGNLAHRVSAPVGFFVEPRFVAGYLHTWVDGDEYWVVDSTGRLRRVAQAGTANLTYGLGLGLGWDFEGPLAVVLRPEILGRTPYNDFVLAQVGIQLGIEWTPGGGR